MADSSSTRWLDDRCELLAGMVGNAQADERRALGCSNAASYAHPGRASAVIPKPGVSIEILEIFLMLKFDHRLSLIHWRVFSRPAQNGLWL